MVFFVRFYFRKSPIYFLPSIRFKFASFKKWCNLEIAFLFFSLNFYLHKKFKEPNY